MKSFGLFLLAASSLLANPAAELAQQYGYSANQDSDIWEHVPVLRRLSAECSSVIEIGLRYMVSTWGILQGLADSAAGNRSYLGIDKVRPAEHTLQLAERLSEENGVLFRYLKADDMTIDLAPTEMLFIDSLHTYCHLSYELEKFSPKVSKYIAMHDTSEPWGEADDTVYYGDFSEYPEWIDRSKRGLWAAVVDFLGRHPEWQLLERRTNNHGFTILRRIGE